MYALLAIRKTFTHATLPTRHRIDFQIVPMGCFNGFNTGLAFTRGAAAGQQDDLSIETDTAGVPTVTFGATAAWGGSASQHQERDRSFAEYTPGPDDTLGIGWLTYLCGATQKTTTNMLPEQNGKTAANMKASPYMGAALYRENFFQSYRNPVTGRQSSTLRVLTPNEATLSNCLTPFNARMMTFSDSALASSKLAVAFQTNYMWNGALYSFVGSERPSGQAIAYLQTFRNAAENSVQEGFTYTLGELGLITSITSNRDYDNNSLVAVLSKLFNHGDDSDIVSFAGNHYLSYCTKVGFWNTTMMFRCTDSMMDEGRYNKGGQASAIRDKLHRARSMQSRSAHHALWTSELGSELDRIRRVTQEYQNLATHTNPTTLNAYSGNRFTQADKNRLIEQIGASIRNIWACDTPSQLNSFFRRAAELPDLNVIAPTTPVVAPAGFTEWVATAHETTVH